jgi:hypothetical protein
MNAAIVSLAWATQHAVGGRWGREGCHVDAGAVVADGCGSAFDPSLREHQVGRRMSSSVGALILAGSRRQAG